MTIPRFISQTLGVLIYYLVQSPVIKSSVQHVIVLLLLCFIHSSTVSGLPQLKLPFATGYTFMPSFQNSPQLTSVLVDPPPVQKGGSHDVEMFYDDDYYVCDKDSHPEGYMYPMVGAILNLEPFVPYRNNCSSHFHPFYLMRIPGKTSKSLIGKTEQFTVLRGETTDVVLYKNNIISVPPNYFCSLNNVTNLEIRGNNIQSSESFGFSKQCGTDCSLTLRRLQLPENKLINIVANSFCGFPSLEELNLSKNLIDTVDEGAFLKLGKLLKLSLSENKLSSLLKNVFRPLHRLLSLDLSANQLDETIFAKLEFLVELKVLRLSSNNIVALPRGNISGLESLEELNLVNNQIVSLDSSFGNLHNLVHLMLSNNKIVEIANGTFHPLLNLTVLKLDYNEISQLSGAHFRGNGRLELLDMEQNKFSSVPDFTLVKSLKKLVLNRNNIITITPDDGRTICNMRNLEEIHLEMISLENIAVGSFDCNLSLSMVNLNNNNLRSIKGVFLNAKIKRLLLALNLIEELWLDDISQDVVEVDLNNNHIAHLRSPLNPRLRNMSLTRLNLASNLITNLTDVYFPFSLEYLLLDYNKIDLLDLGNFKLAINDTSLLLENLQLISLRSNQLESVCSFIFYLIASETYPDIDLNENPLSCSCEISFLMKHMDHLRGDESLYYLPNSGSCPAWLRSSVNKRLSAAVPPNKFSCKPGLSNQFCECNPNSFYSSICNFPCPERCQCYLSSDYKFQFINCTGAGFDNFPLVVSKLPLELHISNNSLKSLDKTMLRSYSKVEVLYLNNNLISRIETGTFMDVPHLHVLNLEFNLLKTLTEGTFDNLSNLTELYLAHNRLTHLSARVFQPLQSLRVLQLHDNNLRNFSVWNISTSYALSRLSLQDNPWSCDCYYVEQFRNWLQNYSHVVEDVSNVFCTSDNGTVQNNPLISFNSSQCYVLKQETLVSNIAVWASVLATLILISLLSVMVFIYRQEMQVLIYTNYGMRIFYKDIDELDVDKIYDAFVAHSALDEEFLANELIPGLEQIEKPYRLCIHQRDFLVGAVITESILEAVEKSRRTIVLLSENFVRSEWCRFEFKSAHLKTLADRCNRLIVIVLGKLPNDLDPEMKLYLKTNTYLEWNDRLFWEKLYFALPDRRPPK